MSRDGSGTYSLPATMATASAVASSTTVNSIMNDVAQALTDSINKDGSKAFSAAQSMGGNRLTSLGAATALTDAVQLSQVQKGDVSRAVTVGGTADAITLNFNPTITSYTTGMRIRWVSSGANTIAGATVNIDSLGAITLKKNPASAALVAGDIGASGTIVEAEYNGTNFIVLNPKVDLSSYATTAAVASTYAPLASPALTGTPTAPTAGGGTNTTQVATTAFVTTAVAGVGGGVTLVGTLSPSGVNTITLSSLNLSSYKFLRVVGRSISTSGSTGTYRLAGCNILAVGTVTDSVQFLGDIDLTTGSGFIGNGGTSDGGTGGATVTTKQYSTGITTATTSITFDTNLGSNFDAGTLYFYGIK